jgi:hypothetical protein
MSYTQHQGEIDVLVDLLNGSYTLVIPPQGVMLDGLTLIFTVPAAGTVTFPTTGSPLSHKAIRDAIVAENIAGLTVKVRKHNGGVALVLGSSAGVSMTAAGTANEALGLSTTAPTARALVDQADIALFTNTSHSAQYILVINNP